MGKIFYDLLTYYVNTNFHTIVYFLHYLFKYIYSLNYLFTITYSFIYIYICTLFIYIIIDQLNILSFIFTINEIKIKLQNKNPNTIKEEQKHSKYIPSSCLRFRVETRQPDCSKPRTKEALDNNNNNNNETRKYWVDVHWAIVSSNGERDPLSPWLAILPEMVSR